MALRYRRQMLAHYIRKEQAAPHISRFLTDGREYLTVTVEMPIVWETIAAGLGTRGVVITPCAYKLVDTNIINNTRIKLIADSFSITKHFS